MTWRPTSLPLLTAVWLVLAAAQTARVAATGSLMSGDGVYHFAHLHSIVVDRDLDPVNEIQYFRDVARSRLTGGPKIGSRTTRNPATGEVVNKYPLGLALLTLPAYVAVYAASSAMAAAGGPADVTGYGWTYQYAVGLAIAAYAVFGLWCCHGVATAQGAGTEDAWWGTLLTAGATPWLFYATLEPLFSHALSATCAALLTWQWLRVRAGDRTGQWFMTGLVAGVGAAIRYQDAVLLLMPGLDLLMSRARKPRRLMVSGLALAFGALTGVLPQLLANYNRFGDAFTTGYFGEEFSRWQSPGLLCTLVSADVGAVRWAPIVLLALVGLVIGAWRAWPSARIGLVVIAVQIYTVSSWYFLSQGHTFGNRMLVNCTVFFALGMATLLSATATRPRVHTALRALGVALVAVNALLIWLWTRGLIGPLGRLA